MTTRTIIATGAVTAVGVSIATGTAWLAAAVVVLYVVHLFIRDAVQRRSREDAWNAVRYNVMPGEGDE
jgi:uncharacterized membrane protein YhiD involved in acid resistance